MDRRTHGAFYEGGERRDLRKKRAVDWMHIPGKPQETLCGGVLLGLELVSAEVLDVLGLGRSGELAVTEFLTQRNKTTHQQI
jgi:hypothetical protein